MPQAIVDPEELRQFARALKKFNAEVRAQAGSLSNQLSALGATWRDQQHQKFVEQFEEHMGALARFTEATEEHVPYLLRKAAHIEDYLQS